MKKLSFILMSAAAAAMAFTSCNKINEEDAPLTSEGSIQVSITTGEIDTKTSYDPASGNIYWLSGDILGVVDDGLNGNYDFRQSSYDGTKTTTEFTGNVDETGAHYAYYPYSSTMTLGSGPHVSLSNWQVMPESGSFDAKADILVSESFDIAAAGPNNVSALRFRRIGAFIDVRFQAGPSLTVDLTSEAINSVTITAESDLVGDCVLNPTTGALSSFTNGSNTVYVGRAATEDIYDSHSFAGVYPQILAEGSKLIFDVETNSHKIHKEVTVPAGGITLRAGHIQPLKLNTNDTDIVPTLSKVWGIYGEAGVCGWPGKVDGIEDLDGNIRNATFDDDFVYIPKTKGVSEDGNFTEYKIFKFNVSDGSYAGLVTPATDPAYMAGTWASTFPVSCARVMKNTEPTVNGGKDILVCTNLCDGQNVRLYAWENGVDQQPRLLTNFTSPRRFGDRISVEGTYQNGRVWYRSFAAGITAFVNLVPGYTGGFNGSHAWNWVEGIGATATEDGDNMITEYTSFNNGAFGIVSSNSGNGIYLLTGTTTTKNYTDYKRCWGWHAFAFNGVNYIAYLDLSTGTDKPIITIIRGASSTVGELKATLDAKQIVARAAFATDDVKDFSTGTAYATNNVGECEFRVIGGEPYILGATRGSIALFKLEL